MTILPTRLSVGCLYISDTYPDEKQQSCSLPQQYYIAAFVGSKDPSKEKELKKHTFDVLKHAEPVSCGMYIADYEHEHRQANVMTPYARNKFRKIKKMYDPENLFPCQGLDLESDRLEGRES